VRSTSPGRGRPDKKDYEDTFVRARSGGARSARWLELGARVTGPGDMLTTSSRWTYLRELQPVRRGPAGPAARHRGRPAAHAARAPRPRRSGQLADGSLLRAAGESELRRPGLQPATGTPHCAHSSRTPSTSCSPGSSAVRLLGLSGPRRDSCPATRCAAGLTGAFVYGRGDSGKVAARNGTPPPGTAVVAHRGGAPGWRARGGGRGAEGDTRQLGETVAYRPAATSAATEAQEARDRSSRSPLRIRSRP